jgi:hypothetical protein
VEIEFSIPAFERISRHLPFRCKGQVTRVEACGQLAGFAVAGPVEEGEQLGGDVEEITIGLLTRDSGLR